MVRRVVAGHKGGKAVVISDGPPPRTHVFQKTPGMEVAFVWATGAPPRIATDDAADPVTSATSSLPPPGESRLVVLTIPPVTSIRTSQNYDAAAAAAEFLELRPEMAAISEPGNPGMHRTESVDYVIVLEGELYLELDDHKEVLLKQQDIVVQTGTRHAWRNRGDRPAKLAVMLIGAQRDEI